MGKLDSSADPHLYVPMPYHQVHIFGEGKVNQRRAFEHGYDVLPRFKWGV